MLLVRKIKIVIGIILVSVVLEDGQNNSLLTPKESFRLQMTLS